MKLNHKTFGAGPPLVVLHGLFGTLDNWQTLARRWAEHYTVILVDQRNHGRSPHRPTMDYHLMAEDLAAFLEEQWVHECYLLGHSMGGKVAMQTALTYPDLVDRLVVVDMAPRQFPRGHDDVFRALRGFDPATLEDRRHADELMKPLMPSRSVRQFLLKNLARDPERGFRWRMNLDVLEADYEKLIGPVGKAGQTFPGPALFVRGGASDYVRDGDLADIRRLFPAAELATVAGAGHWVHATHAEALHDRVHDFLGGAAGN